MITPADDDHDYLLCKPLYYGVAITHKFTLRLNFQLYVAITCI